MGSGHSGAINLYRNGVERETVIQLFDNTVTNYGTDAGNVLSVFENGKVYNAIVGTVTSNALPSNNPLEWELATEDKQLDPWESKVYLPNEEFTFSTTNTTAVDATGKEISPNDIHIGVYVGGATAGASLTNTEMANITLVSPSNGLNLSTEQGNLSVQGDDGGIYSLPLKSTTCYREIATPTNEFRVSEYSDGELTKLIYFDSAGVPIELIVIPATWEVCPEPTTNDVAFVETRCYEEVGAVVDVNGLTPYLDEINSGQLATLPAGAHMRWTAPNDVILNTLEVARLGAATSTTISWTTSNGQSGSDTTTAIGANTAINLGSIALATGDTIDFTLDDISGGQMQLAVEVNSIANDWTALQDYSAFATTSHWNTRLIGTEPEIKHTVNVYEDINGITSYAEVIGEDLVDLTIIDPTWTLCLTTPIVSTDVDNEITEGTDGGAYYKADKLDVCGVNEYIHNIKPWYMVLSKEGPSSGANVTTNVNGVPSVYENLVNSVDNGNGELSWNAGANSNFNSHATTPSIVKCDEYIELIKGNTANFHTEAISISSTNLINAQAVQGDIRIILAPSGYTVYNTENNIVATDTNEAGTYRFTRTLYGFKIEKDGVEIYTSPEVCTQYVETYENAESFYVNTSFQRTTTPRSYDFVTTGDVPLTWFDLADNGGTLVDNNNTLTNTETSTGWIVGSSSNEQVSSVSITMEAQNLATGTSNGLFMFGFSRTQGTLPTPTWEFDYAINVRETLVRVYENGVNISAAQQNGITAQAGDKFEVRRVGTNVEYVYTPISTGVENVFWVSNQVVNTVPETLTDLHDRVTVLENEPTTSSTTEDSIEVQLDGNFTLPTAVNGDIHHFSVENLPVSIDTAVGEPISGDLDFTRYALGDQLTALPQLIEQLQSTGTPITATQPDNAPNTVTWNILPGVVELTRGNSGGLLNSAQGQSGNNGGTVTITDIEWFYDDGNTYLPIQPTSLTDTTTPTTTSMQDAFDGAIGDEILGTNSWIRVISTGQIFELNFTAWQSGGGGGFSATATEMTDVQILGWNVRKTVGEFISADAGNALERRSDGLYAPEQVDLHVLSSFTGLSTSVEKVLVDGIPLLCMADNEAVFTSYTSQEIITPRDVTADVYIDFTIKRATTAQPDSTFSQRSNFTTYHQTFTFNAETGAASVSSGSNDDPVIELAEVGTEFIRYVVSFSEMTGSFSESWRFRPAGDVSLADTGTIYFTEDGFTASIENPITAATNQLIQSGKATAGTTVTFPIPFKAGTVPEVMPVAQFNQDRIISLNTVTATAFDGVSWNTGTNLASSGEIFHWVAIGIKP